MDTRTCVTGLVRSDGVLINEAACGFSAYDTFEKTELWQVHSQINKVMPDIYLSWRLAEQVPEH
jgi:hypothetical protein